MQHFHTLKLSAIALSVAGLVGCGQDKTQNQAQEPKADTAETATKEAKTIAISAIVEHPSLDDIRRGVIAGLADLGYKDGQNLTVNFQSAQGNMATAAQIAKQFAADNPDAIVAISTPTAQSLAAATQTVPLVYTAVSDPVAAKLIDNNNVATQANITGLSSQLPLEPQIELFTKVKPDAKRIGYVYSPGEANSLALKDRLQEILPKYGMTLVDIPANRSADVAAATRALDGRADLIYTSLDNNVASAMEAMVQVANELDLPIIASDEFSVRRGAAAALGVNDFDFGVVTAKMVAGVLDGKKPSEIQPQIMNTLTLYVSPKHAAEQGVSLTDEVKKDAIDVDTTPRAQ
ncbi:ABC transporter substrate-binding protein [Moraxella nasibovis]|uniref:ABC transporter substrate-binding protein n=1 Tax=Moraxella nasibovis TaxID=2904120 RepID=UPI00240ED42F|nr:ABC transporter substrate-binding protein [Moraxella nasibovis]WFF38194.1 ABC transporter substrate-binding protein [Moraxella nasibovis]